MAAWTVVLLSVLAVGAVVPRLARRVLLFWYVREARRLNIPERRSDMITTYPLA